MFIGHYAPALIAAAHPKAPRLGTLFVAAQLVDLAFFSFVILGIEHLRIVPGITAMNPMDLYHVPYTHSLLGSILWGCAFGAIFYAITKNRTGAVIGGLVVLSHWFVDLLVHRPDLTVAGSPPKIGFGLWDYPMIAMPLEIIFVAGALAFYILRTRPIKRSKGTMALLALITLLLTFQAVNWFGPPPENAGMEMTGTALLAYLLAIIAAWWVGRTRTSPDASTETETSH